ncbi:MAG: PHP domain-containing protein, partial [Candidatus Eremiobacteraeota bacterium]|nr:PHP domain-containing protein [Candidatus Eremiobacteraeota bacterium]
IIDLHTHTTFSDGIVTPEDLVEEAINKGIGILSVTDHDSLGGIIPAQKASKNSSLTIIPGIELNAENEHSEVHILVYGIDPNDQVLNGILKEIRQRRVTRIKKILEKLNDLGMEVPFADVDEISRGESLCRPHVARAMVKLGYVNDYQKAFDKYLARGKPAYVPRKKFTPEIAVEIGVKAGGVPVLAHPCFIEESLEHLLKRLIPLGLEGIEIFYPLHSRDQIQHYLQLAHEYNLLITGGSDYHGKGARISSELGEISYPWEEFQKLAVRLGRLNQ